MKKNILLLIALLSVISVFAQVNQNKAQQKKATNTNVVKYTCPMHPEVISNKPGKCPKCGMNLVEKKAEVKKIYTCSMHPEVVSDKPGKCPKCGMSLIEKKKNN